MIGTLRIRGQRAGTIAIVALGCALALLSIQLMRSKPLSTAGLGVEWQCSKTKNFRSLKRYGHHSADAFAISPSLGSLMDLHFIRILKVSSASSIV